MPGGTSRQGPAAAEDVTDDYPLQWSEFQADDCFDGDLEHPQVHYDATPDDFNAPTSTICSSREFYWNSNGLCNRKAALKVVQASNSDSETQVETHHGVAIPASQIRVAVPQCSGDEMIAVNSTSTKMLGATKSAGMLHAARQRSNVPKMKLPDKKDRLDFTITASRPRPAVAESQQSSTSSSACPQPPAFDLRSEDIAMQYQLVLVNIKARGSVYLPPRTGTETIMQFDTQWVSSQIKEVFEQSKPLLEKAERAQFAGDLNCDYGRIVEKISERSTSAPRTTWDELGLGRRQVCPNHCADIADHVILPLLYWMLHDAGLRFVPTGGPTCYKSATPPTTVDFWAVKGFSSARVRRIAISTAAPYYVWEFINDQSISEIRDINQDHVALVLEVEWHEAAAPPLRVKEHGDESLVECLPEADPSSINTRSTNADLSQTDFNGYYEKYAMQENDGADEVIVVPPSQALPPGFGIRFQSKRNDESHSVSNLRAGLIDFEVNHEKPPRHCMLAFERWAGRAEAHAELIKVAWDRPEDRQQPYAPQYNAPDCWESSVGSDDAARAEVAFAFDSWIESETALPEVLESGAKKSMHEIQSVVRKDLLGAKKGEPITNAIEEIDSSGRIVKGRKNVIAEVLKVHVLKSRIIRKAAGVDDRGLQRQWGRVKDEVAATMKQVRPFSVTTEQIKLHLQGANPSAQGPIGVRASVFKAMTDSQLDALRACFDAFFAQLESSHPNQWPTILPWQLKVLLLQLLTKGSAPTVIKKIRTVIRCSVVVRILIGVLCTELMQLAELPQCHLMEIVCMGGRPSVSMAVPILKAVRMYSSLRPGEFLTSLGEQFI
eukprot:g20464.t1